MKKILFHALVGLAYCFAARATAQNTLPNPNANLVFHDDCGTKPRSKPVKISEAQLQNEILNRTANTRCFRVRVTVFHNNNGGNPATTDANVLRQFQNMADQYNGTGICFTLADIRHINNTDLNVHYAEDEEDDLDAFRTPNYIDIFVHRQLLISQSNPSPLNGIAYDIPNTGGYISLVGTVLAEPQTGNISTMGHEIGHIFGLYHTFDEISNGHENADHLGNCRNCEDNGDLLCDTDAWPNASDAYMTANTNATCNFTAQVYDACNVQYTPDATNIMAYGRRECRNHFSPGQAARMCYFVDNEADLQTRLVPPFEQFPPDADWTMTYPGPYNTWEIARDHLHICPFANNQYIVNNTAKHTMTAEEVTLYPGTLFQPTAAEGFVIVKVNPYCK